MSRVGKKPIPLPDKTTVDVKDGTITVKGQKGVLQQTLHPEVALSIADGQVNVIIEGESKKRRALQGLFRSLVANMVTGVTSGFERSLEINGIGYRAETKGNNVVLNLGFSHPIDFPLPDGISATVEKNILKLSGIDKELLGRTAASIRDFRPPEPYKGKGVKYVEEHIIRKAGKAGAK